MRHYRSIQSLRAVAALMVVVFHLTGGAFVTGAAGVDIFFVISGFVMGTVGVTEAPGLFLGRRLVRVIPLYWLATLVMCVGAAMGAYPHFTWGLGSVVQSLLFIPYVDDTGHLWPLLVVGWTLNYELFFYGVFAGGLLIGKPFVVSVATMLVLVVIGSLLPFKAAPLLVWTSPLLLEFVAGLVIAQKVRLGDYRLGAAAVVLACLGLAGVARLQAYDASIRLATWGIPAACIVLGVLAIERGGRWPRWVWPLERIGDASYSLYIWHGFFIGTGHRFLPRTTLAGDVAICVCAILFALVSNAVFERPVGRFLLSHLGLQRRNGRTAPTSRDRPIQTSPGEVC